jgi:hypothetical protein
VLSAMGCAIKARHRYLDGGRSTWLLSGDHTNQRGGNRGVVEVVRDQVATVESGVEALVSGGVSSAMTSVSCIGSGACDVAPIDWTGWRRR